MSPVLVALLAAALGVNVSFVGYLLNRSVLAVDGRLAELVTSVKELFAVASNHNATLADHGARIGALERKP
jgi:hypothetical protein